MSDKKILVTGAGGYIGRHVVKKLLDMGAQVVACDIRGDQIDPRAQVVTTNLFLGDPEIYTLLGKPDACLHMAWRDGFVHQSHTHMEDLSGHYRFIRDMLEAGLSHLAVMGTMHEVGYHVGAIDENTSCNPISLYGIAKDSLRRATSLLVKDKPVVFQWLRAFYIYGDDKRNSSIFAKLIAAEEAGRKTFPFVTGENQYDFIEVEELADQLSYCVLQTQITGIINCCSGKPMSLADKVEEFIHTNGFKIKLNYGAFPDRAYDSPCMYGDSDKIREIMK